MWDPRFWQKLGRWGWFSIAFYLCVAYLAVFMYSVAAIDSPAVGTVDPGSFSSVVPTRPNAGHIETTICDVFGNAVPYARVRLPGREVMADAAGKLEVEDLPVGQLELTVTAPGFSPRVIRVSIEPGVNYPRIRHDTGLWPDNFYVRFHAFTNLSSKSDTGTSLLFGLIEIANPLKDPVFISRIEVRDPNGRVVHDLSDSQETIRHIAQTYDLSTVAEPVPAYVIPRGCLTVLELDAFPQPPLGKYHLWLVYADSENHKRGRYTAIRLTDEMDFDPDLNPHTS